jgi:hypothetical protein
MECGSLYLIHGAESCLKNLTGLQLVKKLHAFYGTQRFIIAFTSARHLPLPFASSIQSKLPHPTSWSSALTLYLLTWKIWWARNNASKWQMGFKWAIEGLILSSHLRLGLLTGLFPSGFPIKSLYTPLPSSILATHYYYYYYYYYYY